MGRNQQPEPDTLIGPNWKRSRQDAFLAAASVSELGAQFLTFEYGNHAHGKSVVIAAGILAAGIAFYPRYEDELTGFTVAWGSAVVLQKGYAWWNHNFGHRQLLDYVGTPIVTALLKINDQLARRVINPAITYGVATILPYPAVSWLLKVSAIGQVVAFTFMYRSDKRQRDMVENARLMARQNR